MKKILIALVCFFTLLPCSFAEKLTVKIGAVLPLTGGMSHIGSAYHDAMRLAIEDIDPNSKFNYELIVEDDQLDLKKTASAAKKLTSIDKANALISMWSNQGKIVAAEAMRTNTVHFGCAWDRTVAESDLSFNMSATPDYFMPYFVKELKRRGLSKLNIIELNDSGSIAAHDQLEKDLKGTRIEMALRQTFNGGERDFRSLITKSKQVESDIYYINAGSPELEIITKQIKSQGIKQPITTIGTFDFTTELELFDGSWYMTMTWPTKEFQERFTKKFDRPIVYQLGNFYEMIRIIVKGFESAAFEGASIPKAIQVEAAIRASAPHMGVLGELQLEEDGTFQSKPSFFKIGAGKRLAIQ